MKAADQSIVAAAWRAYWASERRRAHAGQPARPRPSSVRLIPRGAITLAEFITSAGIVVARFRTARDNPARLEPVDDAELPRLLASSAA